MQAWMIKYLLNKLWEGGSAWLKYLTLSVNAVTIGKVLCVLLPNYAARVVIIYIHKERLIAS